VRPARAASDVILWISTAWLPIAHDLRNVRSLSGHSVLHRWSIGERFHRPNSELGVLVADRSALFISGRRESGLSLFQILKSEDDGSRLRRLAFDRNILSASRQIFSTVLGEGLSCDRRVLLHERLWIGYVDLDHSKCWGLGLRV